MMDGSLLREVLAQASFILVILGEPGPKPPGCGSHDWIGLRFVVRVPSKNLAADDGLFEFVIATLKMSFYQESQQSGECWNEQLALEQPVRVAVVPPRPA
jgi:hypothetical protein